MNKKLRPLICIALIMIISIPVFSIVFARKPDRGPLEKIVFIHHRKDYVKPPWAGGPDKPNGEEDYYKLLGAKWTDEDLPVTYYIDPTDPTDSLLDPDFVITAIVASTEEWDSWTGADLFEDFDETTQIIDDGSWDDDTPDGRNELVFDDYDRPGVIAVCNVWGYFRGASGKGQIIEFDIMFDTDYNWGDGAIDETIMDIQNIATHELGHGVGLADLYDDVASEETMYGSSTEGETKKRTLNNGDKAGIQALYGELEDN